MAESKVEIRTLVSIALVLGPVLAVIGLIASRPSRGPALAPVEPVTVSVQAVQERPPERVLENLAKYEPQKGCYLGAYIDLADELKKTFTDINGRVHKLPSEFEAIVGRPHSIYFFYLGYGQRLPIDWVRKLSAEGKFVHIALEPNDGLEVIQDDDYLQQLADDMRNSGARIFLRFASEMNGPWVNYHGNPDLYKAKWRLVTDVMRERAPNVAMVWCPYANPIAPIKSYYPGDEYVDWVGINFYSVTFFNQKIDTPAFHIKPPDFLEWIYKEFADRKPIMICEYGTTHYSALEKKNFSAFATFNIKTLYSALQTKFPRVKAINYFNVNNLTLEHRQNNNYSVTHDMDVLAAYREAIRPPYFLTHPPDGQISGPGDEVFDLTSGAVISGRVRVTFWPSDPKRVKLIRLTLDGAPIASMDGPKNWTARIDTRSIEPGKRMFRVEAFDNGGRKLASRDLELTVQP